MKHVPQSEFQMASTRTSACSRFFGITELAEKVFLDLSPADLLCGAQQTCKLWKQTVDSSDLIQELLFFKPITYACILHPSKWGTHEEWVLYKSPTPDMIKKMQRGPVLMFMKPIENPFLCMLGHRLRHDDMPTASWRRMHPTQPPPSGLILATDTEIEVWIGYGEDLPEDERPEDRIYQEDRTLGGLSVNAHMNFRIRGSAEWKAFEGHAQLQSLKKDLQVFPRHYKVDEEMDDILEGDDDEFGGESGTWVTNWTR